MLLCLIFVFLAALWLYPMIWFAYVRNSLQLNVSLDSHFSELGDEIYMQCVIQNRSKLPCPRYTLAIDLPDGLESAEQPGLRHLRLNVSLRAHEAITCYAVCRTTKRGFLSFDNLPALMVVSEGLGLRELSITSELTEDISVFPRPMASSELSLQLKEISGKIETNRWIHPDESRLKGIREYVAGDAFKHIAWNASASAGAWMVKQFASSTDVRVHLILNAQFYEDTWVGTRSDKFDEQCSLVDAMARLLSERGFQLHFASNAMYPRNASLHHHGSQTVEGIRVILARLSSQANQDFAALLAEVEPSFVPGDQVILFSEYLSKQHEQMVISLRSRFETEIISVTGMDPDLSRGREMFEYENAPI